jgi:hypothetical protein
LQCRTGARFAQQSDKKRFLPQLTLKARTASVLKGRGFKALEFDVPRVNSIFPRPLSQAFSHLRYA